MTKRETEGEPAEHYDRTRDLSDFEETVAEPAEVRRNVTISVRFSEREIEELRGDAEVAGLKLTADIRAAALQSDSPVDRPRLQAALPAASEDVAAAERLLIGSELWTCRYPPSGHSR